MPETKDWRNALIPAMGTVIMFLLGIGIKNLDSQVTEAEETLREHSKSITKTEVKLEEIQKDLEELKQLHQEGSKETAKQLELILKEIQK